MLSTCLTWQRGLRDSEAGLSLLLEALNPRLSLQLTLTPSLIPSLTPSLTPSLSLSLIPSLSLSLITALTQLQTEP